ncbi:hypothetical protein [Streptomyces sp. NPDC002763]|uniref:hypothetical protein n=1 Tax=Streptomyces sp. NPDC002763 TaxID=3154427 RepID=UPI00332333F2
MKKNSGLAEGRDGLVYTARLPLSSATLNYLADPDTRLPEEDRLPVAGPVRREDRRHHAGGTAL